MVAPGDAFDELASMIGKVSGHVFDGAPTEIIGRRQHGGGRILGLKATYGAGETVTMRIRKDGSYSVSLGMRFSTKRSRSEERRVGKVGVSTSRSRGSRNH